MEAWEVEVRESVRQTLADYTAATDRFDLRALAACFGDKGVLEFPGGAEPLTGPAEIEAGLGAAVTRPLKSGQPARQAPTHVRHHVSSIRFGRWPATGSRSAATLLSTLTSGLTTGAATATYWFPWTVGGCSPIAGSAWTHSRQTA